MSDIHSSFSTRLLAWFDIHGRHDLPWQVKDNPYQVWVSEIMLQQTQVKTVLNYFPRFIARFPDLESLAHATWDEVSPYWAGLGYYARARNLHKASKQVVEMGHFPQNLNSWMQLSGIGRSTAGALMSLGLGQFGVILDGNVKRVLARYFAISGDLSKKSNEQSLWELATQLVPPQRHSDYTQAIMDFGATLCTPKKPQCPICPFQTDCQAFAEDAVLAYPEKKAKKVVPTRQAHVLIFEHQQQWLWLKRPSEGLWGGLYALPLIEDEETYQSLVKTWGLTDTAYAEITHQFTHFTWQLKCHKVSFEINQIDDIQKYFNAEFFTANTYQHDLALPTAMQKIIKQFSLS